MASLRRPVKPYFSSTSIQMSTLRSTLLSPKSLKRTLIGRSGSVMGTSALLRSRQMGVSASVMMRRTASTSVP